jgi:hypothetical protein
VFAAGPDPANEPHSVTDSVRLFQGYVGCTYIGWARTIYLYVYTVYIRYFKQGNHHTYGHTRCVYTVLANPTHTAQSINSVRSERRLEFRNRWTREAFVFNLSKGPSAETVYCNKECEAGHIRVCMC